MSQSERNSFKLHFLCLLLLRTKRKAFKATRKITETSFYYQLLVIKETYILSSQTDSKQANLKRRVLFIQSRTLQVNHFDIRSIFKSKIAFQLWLNRQWGVDRIQV